MTQSHPMTTVPVSKGVMILTPCPGTKDVDLYASLEQLKDAGASALITLMSDDELNDSGVADITTACSKQGVDWFQFPITDGASPGSGFHKEWDSHKQLFIDLLASGGGVAIHCKGGSGRTGLIGCQLLIETGVSLLDSYDQIRSVRPKALSKLVHREYIEGKAARERELSTCDP